MRFKTKLAFTLKQLSVISVVSCAVLLSGCMSGLNYKDTTDSEMTKVDNGNVDKAFATGKKADVLYNMEAGLTKRLGQHYRQSNQDFNKAQRVINVWNSSWANSSGGKLSVAAASMLLNDNVHAYQAKGFEKSFVAMFSALNQVDLNDLANARVAVKQMYINERAIKNYHQALYNAERIAEQKRDKIAAKLASKSKNKAVKQKDKLDHYLYQQIMTKYDFKDAKSPDVLKLRNSYQNAFSHYLAGFIFEALNEPSLARPGYVKAGELSPKVALIRQSINNIDKGKRPSAGRTNLLLIQAVGHAPQIKSVQQMLPISLAKINKKQACIASVNIFFPELIVDKANTPRYSYRLDNRTINPVTMTDVNLMAKREIRDEIPHLIARNITAMVRDIAAQTYACRQSNKNQGMGSLLRLGSLAMGKFLDRADERAWVMLPAYINLNRTTLSYGQHTLSVNVNGRPHKITFKLNQPYQLLSYRIIGDQVYFQLQQSMRS